MSEEQKNHWILSQAKLCEESKRQGFLQSLTGEKKVPYMSSQREIGEFCYKVENGEIYLEYETHYYEFDDDGRYVDDWKTWHNDPFKAMLYLDSIFMGCHDLLILDEYGMAADILDKVCKLEFEVMEASESDDYVEVEDGLFTLADAVSEGMLSRKLAEIGMDWVRAVLGRANERGDRVPVREVLDLLENPICKSVHPHMLIDDELLAGKFPDELLVHMENILGEEIQKDERFFREKYANVSYCIEKGRSPVVLSKYKEHTRLLYEKLREYADRAFLLLGDNPKKEQKKLIEEMKQVSQEQSVLLVATGQLIGEGFDYPRLDTLIMAMPVAWKGVVEQYAGRLNREYEGKETVIVYDYVDRHIPVFDRMYAKRLRAYKQIGYEICTGIETAETKQTNAIFDIDNYGAVYRQDLLGASKEIVISSPGLRRDKVYQVIELLGEQQEKGVLVTIVTWHPDTYKFGSSEARMNLMEELRQAGFQVRLVDDSCEHYTIIDREIVWYGSVNFLSKEDAEDNLMRVCSGKIAEELLEMTFGWEESPEVW